MWYALKVKSRSEKKVSERLIDKGVEVYCPLYTSLRRWSDRKKKIQLPLFNGYIFIKKQDGLKELVQYTPGFKGFVMFENEIAGIRNEEIDRIKKFTGEISTLFDRDVDYHQGDLVKITEGLFEGQNAVVSKVLNDILMLSIREIDADMSVSMSKAAIEKV